MKIDAVFARSHQDAAARVVDFLGTHLGPRRVVVVSPPGLGDFARGALEDAVRRAEMKCASASAGGLLVWRPDVGFTGEARFAAGPCRLTGLAFDAAWVLRPGHVAGDVLEGVQTRLVGDAPPWFLSEG